MTYPVSTLAWRLLIFFLLSKHCTPCKGVQRGGSGMGRHTPGINRVKLQKLHLLRPYSNLECEKWWNYAQCNIIRKQKLWKNGRCQLHDQEEEWPGGTQEIVGYRGLENQHSVACKEGRYCMKSCWFPEALWAMRQTSRCMSTVLSPDRATWHFKVAKLKASTLTLFKIRFKDLLV